eukprot:6263428-Prymnesium_polylepis.1
MPYPVNGHRRSAGCCSQGQRTSWAAQMASEPHPAAVERRAAPARAALGAAARGGRIEQRIKRAARDHRGAARVPQLPIGGLT